MAIAANRQADPDTLRAVLLEILGGERLAYGELDSAPFDTGWVPAPLRPLTAIYRR